MKALLAIAILAAFAAPVVYAFFWARKKSREFRSPYVQQDATPTQTFFFKQLPPNFYVSVQFCIGFALAALLAVLIIKALFPGFTLG